MIENAPATNLFRHFYLRRPDGSEFDAIGDGENACAFFVSSILVIIGKIQGVHGTVASTLEDLEESGWAKYPYEPQPGDVISWEQRRFPDASTATSASAWVIIRPSVPLRLANR